MTDNEIIKSLRCCHGQCTPDCADCPNEKTCRKIDVVDSVIILINRQKAELNKYPIKTIVSNNCEIHSKTSKDYDNLMADIKSEAIKEFAERLKSEYEDEKQGKYMNWLMSDIIDNLVKEMTEVWQNEQNI